MNIRWMWLWCGLLAAAAAAAAGDDAALDNDSSGPGDGLPDALDDHDHDLRLHQEESRNVRPRAYAAGAYNALPSGFRPTPSLAELAGYQQRPPSAPLNQPLYEQPQQQQQQQQQQPLQNRQPQRKDRPVPARVQQELAEEEEEEREEPDRLSQLLQQSKFDCVGKQSGYYADQELACEVFHYCQDSVKHSWICPEGFTFHQVHLICMPPTHDNICQKSAKYHFVNEYLYRPINEEEVQRKPNVSLKYSDRYYPAEVYHDDRYEDEDEQEEQPRRVVAVTSPPAQVFRSAEEVNIPLGQRRPPPPHPAHLRQRVYDFDF